MPCRQCRPLAGDRCQIAEPKPGSSGRMSCKLALSRGNAHRACRLTRGARLRYLVHPARGTASQEAHKFREPVVVLETTQEQGLFAPRSLRSPPNGQESPFSGTPRHLGVNREHSEPDAVQAVPAPAGDRCQIAEPKPGSSGRMSCKLALSRAQRPPRLPLDARRAAPLPRPPRQRHRLSGSAQVPRACCRAGNHPGAGPSSRPGPCGHPQTDRRADFPNLAV